MHDYHMPANVLFWKLQLCLLWEGDMSELQPLRAVLGGGNKWPLRHPDRTLKCDAPVRGFNSIHSYVLSTSNSAVRR